jgi:hypothetical protein
MQRFATLRPSNFLVLAACMCAQTLGCGSNNSPNASSGTSGAASGSASGSAGASGTSGASSGTSGSGSGGSSGAGSGASGSATSGGPVDAGGEAGEGGSSVAGDAGSEGGGLDGAAPDGAVDGGSGNVTLTVMNYIGWCTVSINGGAASAGSVVTASVAPGSTATLVAQPASMAFAIGADPWFGVSQNDGGAAPGTDNDAAGTAETTTATVVVTGNQCVSVCCGDAPTGTGCPTTNPCP